LTMHRFVSLALTLSFLAFMALPAAADQVFFNSGDPDGLMATASRPASAGKIEIESADDFVLPLQTSITKASFTGLLPTNAPVSSINQVVVEIYRVFPLDSTNPPSGNVPTRVNSPSDVAFATRSGAGLTFTAAIINGPFTANNSVLNGIHPSPNQTTGGEGPVTGEEVTFDVNFTTPLDLPAGHYFFIPQVELTSGDFYWLSAPHPITGGTGPFSPDLQTWIRNGDLEPDWLRIGTDIVGGANPPTFNAAFTLSGAVVPLPASLPLLGTGLMGLGLLGWRRKVTS
jgi:hypothetical protein